MDTLYYRLAPKLQLEVQTLHHNVKVWDTGRTLRA